MKKKVGILIGSFNPVHNGHLMMANYILENTDISKVLFIPSPESFGKSDLIHFKHRYKMLEKSIDYVGDPRLEVSDVEEKLLGPGYTSDTLKHLYLEYYRKDEYDLVLIIGADNFNRLHEFHHIDWILENCKVYVIPRPGIDVSLGFSNLSNFPKDNIRIISSSDIPEITMSSTFIRNQLKKGKLVWSYLPQPVIDYIKINKLYE